MSIRIYKFQPHKLNPVTVFIDQVGPNCATVTVQCLSHAWVAHFSEYQVTEKILAECGAHSLAEMMTGTLSAHMGKSDKDAYTTYTREIASAVIGYFNAIDGGEPCHLKN